MFKNVKPDNAFENWCKTGYLLEPPYDYFSFAELCDQSKTVTNLYYLTLMNNLIKEHPTNQEAISALNIFNKRRNNDSLFGKQYDAFWNDEMTNNISRRLEKRRMETVLQLNDDSCAEIEAISKKLRRNVPEEVAFKEIIKVTQNISNELENLDVLLFDDKAVRKLMKKQFDESYCHDLEKKTDLAVYTSMSNPCKELIKLLIESQPSPAVIRKILRKSTLGDEEFDPITHADLNFVEVVSLHFLNLITSPRNPIQHVALERTAASITTVQILNCLFLSNNDIIDLNWFEKEIQLIKNAKWDGVAFCLKNKKFTPMLIEFSGGFDFNTTQKKENDDEGKLVKAIKDILKYTDALGTQKYPIPQYYVRFFENLKL
ncbi:hypothetical protein G6F43_003482 [Rhizopus delemar]|nr:hypothetical protein G6F43_003482 [Rhizopus delemar]